jgi:hypothetical protein
VPQSVKSAELLNEGKPLAMQSKGGKLEICIPPDLRDPFDTVVVLR